MRRSPSRRQPAARPTSRPAAPEPIAALEPRQLFAGVNLSSVMVVSAAAPNRFATLANPAADTVDLAPVFDDPNVPGSIVTFFTSKGNIVVALSDEATPITVANFLSYVNSGAYNGTVIHRSALDAQSTQTTPVPITKDNPAGIIQGGGYTTTSDGITHIATNAAIQDEYTTKAFGGDVQGTLAMAKTGNPDSATSEWFFNNLDNSAGLDTPTNPTDASGNSLGETAYTSFGHVLSGMDVVTAIASLPTTDVTPFPVTYVAKTDSSGNVVTNSDGTTVMVPFTQPAPVTGLTQTQLAAGAQAGLGNLIYVNGVNAQAGTTYAVTSSDPSLVSPSVTPDGQVNFVYGSGGKTGTVTVTATATSAYDGTSATTTFLVTVPPASSTATAPITTADAVAANVTGTATIIPVLANDTDATVALNPATVTVTTAPAHGSTTVDPATGAITYTSTLTDPVFTGDDSFQYTVADAAGIASAPTAVAVHVVATPTVISIGSGTGIRSLVVTEPDGTRGRLSVTGAQATVTFSAGDTTVPAAKGGVQLVSGAGATIANVVLTNAKGVTYSNFSLTTLGAGSVTLGGFTAFGSMGTFNAARATATGTIFLGGAGVFRLGTADAAALSVGASSGNTRVTVGTAVNSSLACLGVLTSLAARSWTVTDGGAYAVSAAAIINLRVPGMFADALQLTSPVGYALGRATVGGATGPWQINGGVFKATVTAPTAGWSLASGSTLNQLTVRGDLVGASTTSHTGVSAATINRVTITGDMTNASVQTTGAIDRTVQQLNHLTVAGAMTGSDVFATGNVNQVTAKSMADSRVYAGVGSSFFGTGGLPGATTDLASLVTIRSLTLRAPTNTFTDSYVGAYTIGRLHLGQVTVANGGTPFGLSANTIGSVAARLNPGGGFAVSGAPLTSAAKLSAYLTRRKVTLGDFTIKLY